MPPGKKVQVDIVGDAKSYTKATDEAVGATNKMNAAMDGINKKLAPMAQKGGIGGMLLGGVGLGAGMALFNTIGDVVGGVLDDVGRGVELASDKAEAASKANILFGDSYDIVERASRTAAQTVGMASGAYLEAAGNVGNLLLNMGIASDEAAGMSNKMLQLAADVGSFNNADSTEVVEAMGAAFRGESDPIQRFGVFLSAAKVEAKALAMGLKDGKKPLDDQARAMATYQIILDQTASAQGDLARTSDGLANAQRLSAARQEESWTRLGDAILPLATSILPALTDAATGAVEMLGGLVGIVGDIAKSFTPHNEAIQKGIDFVNAYGEAAKVAAEEAGKIAPQLQTDAVVEYSKAWQDYLDVNSDILKTADPLGKTFEMLNRLNREFAYDSGQTVDVLSVLAARVALLGGDYDDLVFAIQQMEMANVDIRGIGMSYQRSFGDAGLSVAQFTKTFRELARANPGGGAAWSRFLVDNLDIITTRFYELPVDIRKALDQSGIHIDHWAGTIAQVMQRDLVNGLNGLWVGVASTAKKLGPGNPKGPAAALERTVADMFMTMSEAKDPWKEQWADLAAWAKDPFSPEHFQEYIAGRVRQATKRARESFGAERRRWREIARAYRFIAENEWIDPMTADLQAIMAALRVASRMTKGAAHTTIDGTDWQLPGNNAQGTSHWRGGLTWVGEKGPELVDLPAGSAVMSTEDSMAFASGPAPTRTTNIYVNVNVAPTADKAEVGREITSALQAWSRRDGGVGLRAAIG